MQLYCLPIERCRSKCRFVNFVDFVDFQHQPTVRAGMPATFAITVIGSVRPSRERQDYPAVPILLVYESQIKKNKILFRCRSIALTNQLTSRPHGEWIDLMLHYNNLSRTAALLVPMRSVLQCETIVAIVVKFISN